MRKRSIKSTTVHEDDIGIAKKIASMSMCNICLFRYIMYNQANMHITKRALMAIKRSFFRIFSRALLLSNLKMFYAMQPSLVKVETLACPFFISCFNEISPSFQCQSTLLTVPRLKPIPPGIRISPSIGAPVFLLRI